MSEKDAYLRAINDVRKTLPGEVIVNSTTTRSSGSENYKLDGDCWTVERPTSDDIDLILDGLFSPFNRYAILSHLAQPDDHIGNCTYVQTAIVEEGDPNRALGKFMVDAQFVFGWIKGKASTEQVDFTQKQFRLFVDTISAVKAIFKDFVSETVPDITNWTDVTYDLTHVRES